MFQIAVVLFSSPYSFSLSVFSAIVAPASVGVVNALTVHLNGLGSTQHVLNALGNGTDANNKIAYLC